jgi:hypothetical protein
MNIVMKCYGMGDIFCALNKAEQSPDAVINFYCDGEQLISTARQLIALYHTNKSYIFLPADGNVTGIATGTNDPKPFTLNTIRKKTPGEHIAVYANTINHPDIYKIYNHRLFKYFTKQENDRILELCKIRGHMLLGHPLTIDQSVEVLATCKYAVGIEGGWTHVAAAYNVPYYVMRRNNDSDMNINSVHRYHPNLHKRSPEQIIEMLSE